MRVMGVKRGDGGRRATIKEVAAEVGVSAATVSNAYNRPDQLSGALRERVFEAARRLGYAGPDPMARGLRRRRAGALGVLYEDRLSYAFADPAAVLFLQGLSLATEEAGLGLLLLSGAPGGERDPEAVGGAVVDGFVVYSLSDGDPLVDAALGRRQPVVVVDQPRIEGVPFVGIDDEAAAREAAEYLIHLGHRRFGVVTFPPTAGFSGDVVDLGQQEAVAYKVTRDRLRGYARAVEGAGLEWSEVAVRGRLGNVPEVGREVTGALLSEKARPTALLCVSDQLAIGAMEAARDLGLAVPDDVSVVGFDDVPEAARSTPPLTTVNQPHVEKGRLAGRLLVEWLGREETPRSPTLLPARLVVRGTTGKRSLRSLRRPGIGNR